MNASARQVNVARIVWSVIGGVLLLIAWVALIVETSTDPSEGPDSVLAKPLEGWGLLLQALGVTEAMRAADIRIGGIDLDDVVFLQTWVLAPFLMAASAVSWLMLAGLSRLGGRHVDR